MLNTGKLDGFKTQILYLENGIHKSKGIVVIHLNEICM
jgi:hypothetical protein